MNFDQKTPIYQQLAESIRQDILSGALAAEMAIPSVRQISVEYGLNPQTVLNATQLLIQEGLLEKRRGLGMFVQSNARNQLNKSASDRFKNETIQALVQEAQLLSISQGDLIKLIQKNYREEV
ncbi:MAG: GntR family transcriptional regulator [Candidatus Marinimicrobia bacterium]|jgi:DNA-binding transcriptional regulator YhcF (GntR family)|nr:GntR family transcriptional regulator [Candidatus Neomarinimicrobiota bacterium]MBT4362073.1 GntR family transcriptional regulator [Candidatus Neomarinimicrobiota bacterium]MBT4714129.1 GntR family transcriptional regulator [Candidatus Neomarinimicrobiota bacterium]MBT4946020.1 GntR family transcriptional regulator [Candidatus Neomarinimicrobiota bacterium]MBT5270878.1 GntR family transcriptional regulator [Candidatus Neomarinimicrobiota bacterium]